MSEVDAIISCPKCGFEQPADTYCAKCGVDMTTVPKKPTSITKQPAIIGGIAIFAIIVTFVGVRAMRGTANPETETKSSATLASEISKSQRREHLSGHIDATLAQNIDQKSEDASASAEPAPIPTSAQAPQQVPQADVHFHASHETPPAATAGAKNITKFQSLKKSVDPSLAENHSLVVAFAWTEVSREWLQAMGASEPGLHRIPDLEARLRESQGAYRIVDVVRHRLSDGMTGVALTRGDRIALRFDLASVTENSLSGSMQSSVRMPDGAVRAPAAAALTIEKGQGSIMTLSGPGTGLGPNPTGAEIVVLILPRWSADRNP